jgi:cation diffusion facilitator CzcD-associated flavoprotein CzcO
MHTLGYRFRPWPGPKAIADGPSILEYVRDTAREHGVEDKIRYRSRLVSAQWSTADARWTLAVEDPTTGAPTSLTCGFLLVCAGYYRYDEGYAPALPGVESYDGRLVHPQAWPEDLDHAGQRVVVIGSGATAVTLVPALAEAADVVTGRIETFTPTGVRLTSGEELEADVVVTATGLQLQALGGVRLVVDGRQIDLPSTVAYKGVLFSGVPNLAAVFGYTNASWTLRADLISDWVCRLLLRMRTSGADHVVAEWSGPLPDQPFLELTSGYVQRSLGSLPRQGESAPWRFPQDYLRDRRLMGRGPREFEGLRFSSVERRAGADA